MIRLLAVGATMVAFAAGGAAADEVAEKARPNPERFAAAIKGFAQADRKQAPPQGGAVFIGSSSIRLWDLAKWFPRQPVVNRGFGGSHLADSIHYAPQILLPLRPQAVVVYAGDNDLAFGLSPEQVVEDYQAFVKLIHDQLPQTRIVYVAIKPSTARWKLADTIRETNRRIAALAAEDDRLSFVDVFTPMLNDEGKPRPELLRDDGLHLTEEGYRLWTRLVAPHLGGSSQE